MHETRPYFENSTFPEITRNKLEIVQINLGYLCNLSCVHCHVNAGPKRTELMTKQTIDQILSFAIKNNVTTFDLTGGAPEMNPHFRYLVTAARKQNIRVIDRCNLVILQEARYEDLAEFLAKNEVIIVASLPCYLEENVDKQRGNGVFKQSISALQKLNSLGYAQENGRLTLDLVFNPQGPELPPDQTSLQESYKTQLKQQYDIDFNQLYTIANMPIQRFGSTLISKGTFDDYMQLLVDSYNPDILENIMCRNTISIDWQGDVYDCDFNQMLSLPLADEHTHISDLMTNDLNGEPIATRQHCYGCTAGQGSSCGGALT